MVLASSTSGILLHVLFLLRPLRDADGLLLLSRPPAVIKGGGGGWWNRIQPTSYNSRDDAECGRRLHPTTDQRPATSLLSTASSSPTAAQPPETSPLPPHTFAGMVERKMVEKFGYDNVERVVESWRLLDREYEHREYDEEDRLYQQCHSYVPGLSVREFWDVADFGWASTLRKKYPAIRREFDAVTSDMAALAEKGNNIWAGALTQDAASYGEGWKTLVLMDHGRWDPVNVNLFPVTSKAVHDSGIPAVEVFFTSMQPETSIKPHSDNTNFVLTSHLGLDIPYSGTDQCRLTIGKTTRQWINGEMMMFDTSIIHDAVNDSDKVRYLLMLRLWHPDLTETERAALQFTWDALAFPELVESDDPQVVAAAEERAKAMRAFPEILKGASKIQGFGSGGKKPPKSSKKKRKGKK